MSVLPPVVSLSDDESDNVAKAKPAGKSAPAEPSMSPPKVKGKAKAKAKAKAKGGAMAESKQKGNPPATAPKAFPVDVIFFSCGQSCFSKFNFPVLFFHLFARKCQ